MVLVSASNPRVQGLLGENFRSEHIAGDDYGFYSCDSTAFFQPKVRRIHQVGNDCVFETVHSWYRFQLNIGEKLVMGCTVKDEPIEPVMAREKRGFLSSLLSKIVGRK